VVKKKNLKSLRQKEWWQRAVLQNKHAPEKPKTYWEKGGEQQREKSVNWKGKKTKTHSEAQKKTQKNPIVCFFLDDNEKRSERRGGQEGDGITTGGKYTEKGRKPILTNVRLKNEKGKRGKNQLLGRLHWKRCTGKVQKPRSFRRTKNKYLFGGRRGHQKEVQGSQGFFLQPEKKTEKLTTVCGRTHKLYYRGTALGQAASTALKKKKQR